MFEDQVNIYNDTAPDKVCFQVIVKYQSDHTEVVRTIPKKKLQLESDPFKNFPDAVDMAGETALKIRKMFPESMVAEADIETMEDDYLYYVVDPKDLLIAQVGVSTTNYRNETIH